MGVDVLPGMSRIKRVYVWLTPAASVHSMFHSSGPDGTTVTLCTWLGVKGIVFRVQAITVSTERSND